MELEITKKFNFNDDDLTLLWSVLHKLNKEVKKTGFNKSIQLDKFEIAFCNELRKTLNDYFGYEDNHIVGKGGGVQSGGLVDAGR